MNRISLISFLFFLFVHGTISSQEKTTLIIDADTGNEVDGMKRDFFKSVSEYFSKGNSPGE